MRARPLLSREEKTSKIVLSIPDDTHVILSKPFNLIPTQPSAPSVRQSSPTGSVNSTDDDTNAKAFSFDRCLWSVNHDHPSYASQETVYETVGRELVDHVLQGFNIAVLAYGQTGSGKTYTMMGNSHEMGLIGHMSEAILNASENSQWRREFEVSYMEGQWTHKAFICSVSVTHYIQCSVQ